MAPSEPGSDKEEEEEEKMEVTGMAHLPWHGLTTMLSRAPGGGGQPDRQLPACTDKGGGSVADKQ